MRHKLVKIVALVLTTAALIAVFAFLGIGSLKLWMMSR
jgi:hypothetical protein